MAKQTMTIEIHTSQPEETPGEALGALLRGDYTVGDLAMISTLTATVTIADTDGRVVSEDMTGEQLAGLLF